MEKQVNKKSPLGSSFDSFLKEEGIYNEVTKAAKEETCRLKKESENSDTN